MTSPAHDRPLSQSIVINGRSYLMGMHWIVLRGKVSIKQELVRARSGGYKGYVHIQTPTLTEVGIAQAIPVKGSFSLAAGLVKTLRAGASFHAIVPLDDTHSWYIAISNGVVLADSDVVVPHDEAFRLRAENGSMGEWTERVFTDRDDAVDGLSDMLRSVGDGKIKPLSSGKKSLTMIAAALVGAFVAYGAWHHEVVKRQQADRLALLAMQAQLAHKAPPGVITPVYKADVIAPPWDSAMTAAGVVSACHEGYLRSPLSVSGYKRTKFQCNEAGATLSLATDYLSPAVNPGLLTLVDHPTSGWVVTNDGGNLRIEEKVSLPETDLIDRSLMDRMTLTVGKPESFWHMKSAFNLLGGDFTATFMPMTRGVITLRLMNAKAFTDAKLAVPPQTKTEPAPWGQIDFTLATKSLDIISPLLPPEATITHAEASEDGAWTIKGAIFVHYPPNENPS